MELYNYFYNSNQIKLEKKRLENILFSEISLSYIKDTKFIIIY